MDINAAVGGQSGLTKEKIEAAFGTGDASALDARERLVVEYADRVTSTPVDVTDELFETLRAAFGERELVELTAVIAHESFNSKFNRALRIEANGLCSMPLPATPPPPTSPSR
ncbi:MAG: carboxymuconolactone decarboxylase family protein [Candidatus Binatia bacterium]